MIRDDVDRMPYAFTAWLLSVGLVIGCVWLALDQRAHGTWLGGATIALVTGVGMMFAQRWKDKMGYSADDDDTSARSSRWIAIAIAAALFAAATAFFSPRPFDIAYIATLLVWIVVEPSLERKLGK